MKKGTIVLTPFPFTDLKGKKVRPDLVISSEKLKGEGIIYYEKSNFDFSGCSFL